VEPVPETFALLSSNAMRFKYRNVSLMNLALSDRAGTSTIFVPRFDNGLPNYYQASLNSASDSVESCAVLTIALDTLEFGHAIKLIKIDAEGHDERVIAGMLATIAKDKPTLIVESPTARTYTDLAALGYAATSLQDSPNTIFLPIASEKRS
jgi:FkbM family methyltransferase